MTTEPDPRTIRKKTSAGSGAFSLRVLDDLDCIAVCWTGRFAAELVGKYYEALADLPAFRRCTRILHDGRDCDLDVDAAEIRRASYLPFAPRDPGAALRIAILVGSDVAFGMFRVMGALRTRDNVQFQVFRTYAEAAEWLGLPPHEGELFDRL